MNLTCKSAVQAIYTGLARFLTLPNGPRLPCPIALTLKFMKWLSTCWTGSPSVATSSSAGSCSNPDAAYFIDRTKAKVTEVLQEAHLDPGDIGKLILVGAHYRNGDLPKRAEKHLDQMPVPTLQDMEWLVQ
jgi:hypothetical protein